MPAGGCSHVHNTCGGQRPPTPSRGSRAAYRPQVPSLGCWVMITTWVFQLDRIMTLRGDTCDSPPSPECGTDCNALYPRDNSGIHCLGGSKKKQYWGGSYKCVCVTASDTVCVIFVRGSQVGLTLNSNAFWSWTKEVSDATNVHWARTKSQAFLINTLTHFISLNL